MAYIRWFWTLSGSFKQPESAANIQLRSSLAFTLGSGNICDPFFDKLITNCAKSLLILPLLTSDARVLFMSEPEKLVVLFFLETFDKTVSSAKSTAKAFD